MAKKNTVALVAELARPIAAQSGLDIWDVVFEKEGSAWFLRVLLDSRERPVTVDDCEAVSRRLSDRLDETDPIDESYYLEVSSAGLGRRLKRPEHFAAFAGAQVSLKLIRPRDGKREFTGILGDFDNGSFSLQTQEGEQSFKVSECAFVKLDDDLDLF